MAILVTPPNHGTVTLLADGTLSYTPSAGFFGIDTIQYQVSDGFFTSNVVTIEITVIAGLPSGGGDPPPIPIRSPIPIRPLIQNQSPKRNQRMTKATPPIRSNLRRTCRRRLTPAQWRRWLS